MRLAGALAYGTEVEDDARLRAVFKSLTITQGWSPEMRAHRLRVDADHIATALREPAALSAEETLPLALRGQWLISVLNLAMPG